MTTIFILMLLFLAIGLFARKFNSAVRFLLLTVIVCMLVYLNLAK